MDFNKRQLKKVVSVLLQNSLLLSLYLFISNLILSHFMSFNCQLNKVYTAISDSLENRKIMNNELLNNYISYIIKLWMCT